MGCWAPRRVAQQGEPCAMRYVPPELRLKVDADLIGDAPPYVLALESLSIVAVLRELSWQLAVTLTESYLDESEYAATLIEVLCPMAVTARLLPPGARWNSHATLRLHTETRMIEDSDETEEVVLVEFCVHDLEFSRERLYGLSPRVREKLIEAYEEETAIIRALDGFIGDGTALLERLRVHMEYGATLARAQLFYQTAQRAQMGLQCLYTENPIVRKRIDRFATWLNRLQDDEERLEESLTSPSAGITYPWRKH